MVLGAARNLPVIIWLHWLEVQRTCPIQFAKNEEEKLMSLTCECHIIVNLGRQ